MNALAKSIVQLRVAKNAITVERLHLFTGAALVSAGIIGFYSEGVAVMLSWSIFGAMYISMSDIGECRMCCAERASGKHKARTFAAYLGAVLSVWLLATMLY